MVDSRTPNAGRGPYVLRRRTSYAKRTFFTPLSKGDRGDKPSPAAGGVYHEPRTTGLPITADG
jgi:hypothetical protein